MKKIKRFIRLLLVIFMMALVGLGIGMAGGVVIPRSNKKEDQIEIAISAEENEDEESELVEKEKS